MLPYSHIVIASKLESHIRPENLQEYYWGAVAPDLRYLGDMKREQTHIPSKSIIEFIVQYPHLKSFLQGYLIHCLSDEIDLRQIFFRSFYFSVLKRRLSYQHIVVIYELFNFKNEQVYVQMSGKNNEVLNKLGLDESISTRFSFSIRQYITSTSSGPRLSNLSQLLGLENDSRVAKYLTAARSIEENWLLKNLLFFGIRTAKISKKIVLDVSSSYSVFRDLC